MTRFITVLFIFINITNTSFAQTAPDFTFTDINGTVHNLQHALNQDYIVLVEFFFADCGPCITAASELQSIYNDYAGKNVLIWAISDIDDNARIIQFHEEMGLEFISGGIEGNGEEVLDLFEQTNNFIAYPTVSIICPNGELTWDIYPYSLGAPEWRDAIEKCGVENAVPYEPIGSTTTDISQYSNLKPAIQISPNPANDFISLTLEEIDNSETIEINIFNAIGVILKKTIQNPTKINRSAITVITSDLPSGVYFLSIEKGRQSKEISRFIIKR